MASRTQRPPGRSSPGALNASAGINPGNPWDRFRRWAADRLPGNLWNRLESRRLIMAGLLYGLILTVLLANKAPEILHLEEGEVAPVDIMAPRDIVDRYRTEQLRNEAARQALREAAADPASYELNAAAAQRAQEKVSALFDVIATVRAPTAELPEESAGNGELEGGFGPPAGDLESEGAPGTDEPNAGAGGSVTAEEATAEGAPADQPPLAAGREAPRERAVGAEPVALPLSPELVDEARAAVASRTELAVPDHVLTRLLTMLAGDFERARELARALAGEIMSRQRIGEQELEAAREGAAAYVRARIDEAHLRDVVAPLVRAVVEPNLVLSRERLDQAYQQAVQQVQEVVVREGQVIVRRGDPVRPEHLQLLRDLGMLEPQGRYAEWAGTALLLLLLFAFAGVYARQFTPEVLRDDRLLALFGLIVLLVVGLTRVASLVPWDGVFYLVPVALASMLLSLLVGSGAGLAATIILAVIVGNVASGDIEPAVMALAGGMAGVFSVSRISQRGDLTRAGLVVGGTCAVTMTALGLVAKQPFLWEYSFLGLVNGVVSAVAAIGLLPYLESIFGITSTIGLLELSNPNQPLLRKLLMEAPGSYHHSMIVGNLSEAAADAIGADSLLVRVGSLYHDVGKTKRPYFFSENQFGGDNPHDKISPTLSTLIITSHVKDGVELAREHNLPEVLVDFIREHHGTALVKYFYQKALEMAKGDPVDENDFRYPGPRPQSRETAIVMLADCVEAAVRSLSNPTPGRIEGLVRKIVKDKLAEGELDESDLTLRDLDRIAEAFVKVLTGIFHKRVAYPELALSEAGKASAAAGEGNTGERRER